MFLWIGNSFKAFVDAIDEQSQYADSEGLMWDRFGGLIMYACSVYGLSTLFVALILNRTAIIALTNLRGRASQAGFAGFLARREWLKVALLAFLRLVVVATLSVSVCQVLVALSVKKQFEHPELLLRLTRAIPLDWFNYDPLRYDWEDYMSMPQDEVRFGPTTKMLWPIFWSVSFSLFVETFASAINGNKPFLEGGITLFELSLAFQEMSLGFFFLREHTAAKRPSEAVLMVALFSLADNITNHLGALLYDNKYRLVPLTFLNFWFVWYFVSTITSGPEMVFAFPYNILLTYWGLVLVLVIISICVGIFLLAMVVKGQRLLDLNYASYFFDAEETSEFFSKHLNVSLRQDFYTAAINVSLYALTLAGNSSYITEYSVMRAPSRNWLEQDLWAKVQAAFGTDKLSEQSQHVQNGKVLEFLRDNNLSGYGNIISTPPERMISGSDTAKPSGEQVSTMRVKFVYLREIARRFGQLVWLLMYKSLIRQVIPRAFKRYVLGREIAICDSHKSETEEQFQARKLAAPKYIQHLVTRREEKSRGFNLGEISDEELSLQYARILQEQELDEEDDSPDFAELDFAAVDLDYESESDVESIDLTLGQVVRASGRSQGLGSTNSSTANFASSVLPINELLTSDAFLELVDHHEILQQHLQFAAGDGVLTRARYRAINHHSVPQDESQALLQLLLSTRHQNPRPADYDDEDIDPRLACVVCQVKPREIITWPCKCFAICESCRLSLASKGMEGCVCCRRDVEGVLKVFLP